MSKELVDGGGGEVGDVPPPPPQADKGKRRIRKRVRTIGAFRIRAF
jgi:hypothetical protein